MVNIYISELLHVLWQQVLNQMAAQLEENGQIDFDVKLKELLGHTPLQVFMGSLLGFAIAALRYF